MRSIAIICIMIIGASMLLSSCADFKETRAQTKAEQRQRKEAYAAKQAEEEIRIEAEKRYLAEAMAREAAEAQGGGEAAPVVAPQMRSDSLLFQFDRGACFGRCPIYKIKIFESGYTIYEGVNFVQNMGVYHTWLSQTEVATIYSMLAEADFFSLEDKYDDERLMDLPSLVFKANAMGKSKRIVARYHYPDVLKDMAERVDAMFADTEWMPGGY